MENKPKRKKLIPEIDGAMYKKIWSFMKGAFKHGTTLYVKREGTITLVNRVYWMYRLIELQGRTPSVDYGDLRVFARQNEKICIYFLSEYFAVKNINKYVEWMYESEHMSYSCGMYDMKTRALMPSYFS